MHFALNRCCWRRPGITNVVDPLGGSWFVEALTDQIEAEAEKIFAQIKALGGDGNMTAGVLRGIENGWFTGHIAEASYQQQQALESGERRIVGVNAYTDDYEPPLEIMRVSHEVETRAKRGAGGPPGQPRPGEGRRGAAAGARGRALRREHGATAARGGPGGGHAR